MLFEILFSLSSLHFVVIHVGVVTVCHMFQFVPNYPHPSLTCAYNHLLKLNCACR